MNNQPICSNRLLVVESLPEVKRFADQANIDSSRHLDFLEYSEGRYLCSFETSSPPLLVLQQLSQDWPKLVLVLDYDNEATRTKGLIKAIQGSTEHFHVSYSL